MIPGELDDRNFADHTDLHRRTDIQLRELPRALSEVLAES
jgi:hypothetical protein